MIESLIFLAVLAPAIGIAVAGAYYCWTGDASLQKSMNSILNSELSLGRWYAA